MGTSRKEDCPEACRLPTLECLLRLIQREALHQALDVLRLDERETVFGVLRGARRPASDREALDEERDWRRFVSVSHRAYAYAS